MIRPIHDRVIVARVKQEEKIGLIHIPDVAKEKPIEAIVVAVGPGKMITVGGERVLEPMTVKVKDRVVIGKYAGMEIEHNGEKYLALREDDILGVVE